MVKFFIHVSKKKQWFKVSMDFLFLFSECRVLSESPYPSNLDFLNISVVTKYSSASQCSLVSLSSKYVSCKFWQNNENIEYLLNIKKNFMKRV